MTIAQAGVHCDGSAATSTPTVLYFAYGSNMLAARLRERAPTAIPRGVAVLSGYALRWHKVSNDGSGKCDVVPSDEPGAKVYGVLYEVPVDEKPALDRAEGLGIGYAEQRVVVDRDGKAVEASAYVAIRVDPSQRPYSWYRALVAAGAREHELPARYVAAIEAADAVTDPDGGRHARNMALAGAGVSRPRGRCRGRARP